MRHQLWFHAVMAGLLASTVHGTANAAAAAQQSAPEGATQNGLRADSLPLQLAPQQLTITVGEISVLPIEGKIIRLALGSGSILSTTTVDSNLLLIAEQVGATSLLVWTNNKVYSYRVQVVQKNMGEIRAKVEALTRGIPGITVESVGSELLLSGIAHRDKILQLSAALKDTPGVILNLREDQGSGFTRSVLFRLHFVEVKRSLLKSIGIDWVNGANGPTFGYTGVSSARGTYNSVPQQPGIDVNQLLVPSPPFVARGTNRGGLFLGLATTLTSRINLGISDGDVRLLASPELTAKSGGKARLQVGGEVPIPVSGAFGATSVEFKPYGIILSIEPQIDASDTITAKISTELSQIDPAVSVSGIPGFVQRSTSTEVSIKPGEMVALAGLVNSEMAKTIDRVPVLSRIPILGSLFRSDDFRSSKTELVILLEPEIISPGDGLANQLRERGEANLKEFHEKTGTSPNKPGPVAQAADEARR
jgi:pilus assembly protein CpaC